MDEALAYFLELRVRLRGRPEALVIVDRCLVLLSRAANADTCELVKLEREVDDLCAELAARFGSRGRLRIH